MVVFFPGCLESSQPQRPPDSCKVIFYTNSLDTVDIPAQIVDEGSTIYRPYPDPVREGYTFIGWYISSDPDNLGVPWDFETDVVRSNMTLWAHWIEKK